MTPEEAIEAQLDQIEGKIVADIMSDEGVALPIPGSMVWYQTDGRNYDYYVPALVRITKNNLVSQAVDDGVIADLTSRTHVHLWVVGGEVPYNEYDVPYDPRGTRRSWRWPDTKG